MGTGAVDHALEHLGRDDHRLAGIAGLAHQALLDRRQRLDGQFDTKVAARDHDAVGSFEDLGEGRHGGGLLDLRHDRSTTPGEIARLGDVGGTLHEAEAQPVDPERADEFEIAAILAGKRGKRQDDIGHVHALAVGDLAADHHFGDGVSGRAFGNPQADLAVIDQEDRAGLQGFEDLGMRQADAAGIARLAVKIKAEALALGQPLGTVSEHAAAQFRALQVGEDPDRAADLGLDFADMGVAPGDVGLGAVAHVQAEHVSTGEMQLADHLHAVGGRAEGCHDLDVALSPVRFHVGLSCRAGGICPGYSDCPRL